MWFVGRGQGSCWNWSGSESTCVEKRCDLGDEVLEFGRGKEDHLSPSVQIWLGLASAPAYKRSSERYFSLTEGERREKQP